MSLAKTVLPCSWAPRSPRIPYYILMIMETVCKYRDKPFSALYIDCCIQYAVYCRLRKTTGRQGGKLTKMKQNFNVTLATSLVYTSTRKKKLYKTDEKVTHILLAENRNLYKKETHKPKGVEI